jgi:sugar phosphate isomerase/epimerase
MTTFDLGINTCFAVKRWPRPADWAAVVHDELGLDVVQHSFDLEDFDVGMDDRDIAMQAQQVRAATDAFGLTVHSTFTGLAAYSGNLLLHPDPRARARAEQWYLQAIDFTAALGARATGGHVGAFSVADWRDAERRAALCDGLRDALARLAGHARAVGLRELYVENLAVAREPSTMAWIDSVLTVGDALHVPIALCLDVGHQCIAGTSGDDRDPYAWLRRYGARAPVVQLQQSDATADHHWPFTPATNTQGRIEAGRVLDTLADSGATHVTLVLEVIPPFEAADDEVLADLVTSVDYWRAALRDREG